MNGDGKNGAPGAPPSFGDWPDQYSRDQEITIHAQEIQNQHISQLTKDVADLAATVRAVVENQKGIFGRQNRPIQWGALIGGFTMLGVMAGLLITPIQRDTDALRAYDINDMKHRIEDAREVGILQEKTRWLERMEDRTNRRIHGEK